MSNEFKIRRGQVFYVTTSEQSVPYIVLSNNKCNESSSMIHAAPVKQGQPDPEKYYHIPYMSTCNRCKYVDVGLTQLMSKSMFEECKYSAAESYYTVNNKGLLEGIADALCVHLGIHRNYVVYNEDPTQEEKKEPINITINLAGLPGVTAQVTETKEVQISPETVSTSIETVTEMEKEPVKFTTTEGPSEWTVTNTRTGKTETINTESTPSADTLPAREEQSENMPKKCASHTIAYSTDSRRTRFSKEEKENIKQFTKKNYCVFGGNMSLVEVANSLGVSSVTISRVTSLLKQEGIPYQERGTLKAKAKRTRLKGRSHTVTKDSEYTKGMTTEEIEKLVNDYIAYGSRYIVDNYKQFKTAKSVHNFIYNYLPIEKN